MDDFILSLRQRKLIHYLQFQKSYTTGEQLAEHLHISTRTIRNEIREINQILTGFGVRITSKRSYGYILEAQNPDVLKQLSLGSDSFLSRDERIRYIAFALCLSDTPLELYDLEDEMYISRTTLEHDIVAFRKKYILQHPHIGFKRHKNHIFLEKDERKRRIVLNRLFAENWNYNSRGNAYYQYQYLDERIVNIITREINFYMSWHNIQMEDINMVTLDLAISIMYYRITSGHILTNPCPISYLDADCVQAADELLDSLEKKLDCHFPEIERQEVYYLISCGKTINTTKLNFKTVETFFEQDIITFTDAYIKLLFDTYCIDFSNNEDFYITMLKYVRYLKLPLHYFNTVSTHSDTTRSKLLIEFEMAFAIQPMALEFYGNYLDYTELLYLAFCISGALTYANRTAPKLKTVIMCHLNLPATWNLKHKVLGRFDDYIDCKDLLSVYEKDNYDFSNIDLVITTADKEITDVSSCKTLVISPFFTVTDQENLENHILRTNINRLYTKSLPSLKKLFDEAFWHECINTEKVFDLIEILASDFIKNGYVSEEYLTNILQREAIMNFAFQPDIVLVYSITPSTRTCLSIATLEHRIKWNSYKIRTVIMATIKPEDATLIFRLINELYNTALNPEELRFLKTKEELISYFKLNIKDY